MLTGRFTLTLALLSLASCASVDVRRVDETDQSTHGVRYCRPAPYLMIIKKATGDPAAKPGNGKDAPIAGVEIDAKIVMLPDRSQTYAITWSSGLFGSVKPDLTLQDGWNLTALNADINSNGQAVLDTLLGSITGLVGPEAAGAPKPGGIEVLLYPIKPDDKSPTGWSVETSKPLHIPFGK